MGRGCYSYFLPAPRFCRNGIVPTRLSCLCYKKEKKKQAEKHIAVDQFLPSRNCTVLATLNAGLELPLWSIFSVNCSCLQHLLVASSESVVSRNSSTMARPEALPSWKGVEPRTSSATTNTAPFTCSRGLWVHLKSCYECQKRDLVERCHLWVSHIANIAVGLCKQKHFSNDCHHQMPRLIYQDDGQRS